MAPEERFLTVDLWFFGDDWARQTLISAGITVVVTRSSLFALLRDHGPKLWRSFISCPLCVGVWVGALLSAAATFSYGVDFSRISRLEWLFLLPGFVGIGALAGSVALLYTVAIDFLDDAAKALGELAAAAKEAKPAIRTQSLIVNHGDRTGGGGGFSDSEPPTDHSKKTAKLSDDTVRRAEAEIALRKAKDPPP